MKSILIVGGQFGNQGAYLMLRSAAEEIRTRFDAAPVVDWTLGTAEEKAKAGVGGMLTPYASRRLRRDLSLELPGRLRRRLPVALSTSVSAVFDISGFRYGDQWAHLPLSRYASYLSYWRSVGVPVYLLPQAFGPFEKVADATREAFGAAELIMARDPDSERFAKSLLVSEEKIRLFGDFTDGIGGYLPPSEAHLRGRVPIVANYNIGSRGPSSASHQYVQTLCAIVDAVRAQGLEPIGLPHGGGRDAEVLAEVSERCGGLEVVRGLDGVAQKGLIAAAPYIVSGRFHAVVSALSQGVPALIHGWSHKYVWLARDYDAESLVQDPLASVSANVEAIRGMQDPILRQRIAARATMRERETEQMWDTVRSSYELRQRA